MKRIISFLTLVFSIFAIGGCNNKGQTNVSNVEYLAPTSKENIAHNLKVASKEIKSVSFNGGVSIDGKTYEFSGKVIVKDTIANTLLYIVTGGIALIVAGIAISPLSPTYGNTAWMPRWMQWWWPLWMKTRSESHEF